MNYSYEPLITVVIPIYNVEKYIKQCLDSVTIQSYKNLEIICVNDCSQDNCLKIVEEYAKKDYRFIILNNPKNLGLGLTRNEGIKIARGEYIHCLDSDDWLEPDAYETLVKHLNNVGKIDVIRFRNNCFNNNRKVLMPAILHYDFLNKVTNIYQTPTLVFDWCPSAWAKLIRTDFIKKNNLYYNSYKCLEDIEYSILLLIKAKSIYSTEDVILSYRMGRKNSLLRKKNIFYKYIIEDTKMTNELAKTLSSEVRPYILFYVYKHFIGITMEAYYNNKITFFNLKKIFSENIDYNILDNDNLFESKYNANLYNKIMSYNSIHFWFSFCVRNFLKKHFYFFVKVYFYIKRKLNET